MKILHLMLGNEKFTKRIAGFYNRYFNNGEHEICYISKVDSGPFINEDLELIQYEFVLGNNLRGTVNGVKLIKLMKKYDYVIMHSFGTINGLIIRYLCIDRLFLKRHVVWIEWGYDLYDFKMPDNPSVRNRIGYYAERTVRSNINSVITIFPPDCEEYRKKFPKSNANVYFAPYMARGRGEPRPYNKDNCRLRNTIDAGEPIYIQIGHNGQQQLHHLETLKLLLKFRDENIKLFLPLNYSTDEKYYQKIITYLNRNFEGKYIILDKFMPRDDYFKLIERIDIAIFNTYRQTALGNIYYMIQNNVKLFMPGNSVMYKYFSSIDIPIFDINDISHMDFPKLCEVPDWDSMEGPERLINELNDFNARKSYWDMIYNELRDQNEQ